MWCWWQLWFDWWVPPSRPAHEVVTVDFSKKRVIGRLASSGRNNESSRQARPCSRADRVQSQANARPLRGALGRRRELLAVSAG